MFKRIDWIGARSAVWSRPGVAAILMAPNALPIAFWFFQTASPITYNFETATGLDMFGQALLAVLVGTFAVIVGVAIDLGLVKIAVSPPTHTHRFKSLTFWIPVAFCIALWGIQYDYYSHHTWVWDMSTFTHLFYPTASMLTAIYWSWSIDWVEKVTAPHQSKIDYLSRQVQLWVNRFDGKVNEATQELTGRLHALSDLTGDLTKRAESAELFNREFNAVLEQLNNAHADTIRDLRGALQRKLSEAHAEVTASAQAEIDRLVKGHADQLDRVGTEHREQINQLTTRHAEVLQLKQQEVEQLTGSFDGFKGEIDRLKERAPGTFQFLTMKEAIEDYIAKHGDPGNQKLIAHLGIKDEQIATFRSQVSQVRQKLPQSVAA